MAKRKSGSPPGPAQNRGKAAAKAAKISAPAERDTASANAGATAKPVSGGNRTQAVSTSAKRPRGRAAKLAGAQVPVVAVGASAGGLEAFTQLLQALPPDTGMAFVLITHLSHAHKSMLSELLGKVTAMPVTQVGRQVTVRPNHVYVIPPNADLEVGDGLITAKRLSTDHGPHLVIDHFMRSLAENRMNRAIGVVLSGTGSDGTLGLAAIRAEGGVTFVQDEKSARYSDMPRNAWAAGSSDFRLPPDQIAAELARISRHPYVAAVRPDSGGKRSNVPASDLSQIFLLVRMATGVDFTHYKPTTIRRRISRRMLVHKLDSLSDYVALLAGRPDEVTTLFQDLLINVTGFFRDNEMFEVLRQEFIPALIAKPRRDAPVRAWVPGCATGEEAYSIAICLLEALGDSGPNRPIQVFGSDVSENAIKRARNGFYPENIAADVSAERLRRFFVRSGAGYQIAPQVRDICVFAPQNLINDPPFSRIDLISCRNVLIYLGAELQKRALSTIHYALRPAGVLVLGTSETVGTLTERFRVENKKYKIYTKLFTTGQPHFEFGPRGPERALQQPAAKPDREPGPRIDLSKEVDELLLKRYAPAGVVIDKSLDIVHFRGQTSLYLEPAQGKASLNLLKMAREGLLMDLRSALHLAQKSAGPVRKEGIRILEEDAVRVLNFDVIPLSGGTEANHYYLVLFEPVRHEDKADAKPRPAERPDAERAGAGEEILLLRQQLARTQGDLHSIIEEQEASNEELQSANEEILSSNEELQSTNEEMETAKEELQATNEELSTLNDELQHRNTDLARINNDLVNLIASLDIVIVMVSLDLRIRRFTPSAQRVMNLIGGDIGRPLRDINTRLEFPQLEEMLSEVIDTMTVKEQEIQDNDGRWYSLRLRPYRTLDNKIDGAVLVLVEIDELKRLEQTLRLLSRVFQVGSDPIVVQDMAGKIIELNGACESFHGWAREELLGKPAETLIPPERHAPARALLERCKRAEEVHNVESVHWNKGGQRLPVLVSVTLIKNDKGEPAAMATIARHRDGG